MKAEATAAIGNFTSLYYRLVALWVVCEAFAGGIMHAFKIPFTGMFVSSLSVICLVLIAWYIPEKNAIAKATIIVAIFKLMLSPHSPPTAYIAVFFQGMLTQFLFSNKNYFLIKAMALGLLSLVESALQRLLILLIVYGNNFWQAVDGFLQKVFGHQSTSGIISWIAWGYIIIHAIVGIGVGFAAASLAKKTLLWQQADPELIPVSASIPLENTVKEKKVKWFIVITWGLLAILFFQSVIFPGGSVLATHIVLQIIIRALLIMVGWIYILSPILLKALEKIFSGKKKFLKEPLMQVQKILPEIKQIFIYSLAATKNLSGIVRIKSFIKILLSNILRT